MRKKNESRNDSVQVEKRDLKWLVRQKTKTRREFFFFKEQASFLTFNGRPISGE